MHYKFLQFLNVITVGIRTHVLKPAHIHMYACNPVSPQQALGAVVALDVTGLIMGWRYFDHAAHLGGVLFGV